MRRGAVAIGFLQLRGARWLAAMLLVAGFVAQAAAQDADTFSAKVTVDATADSPTKARDLARLDGQRRALNAIAERMAAGGAAPKVPKLDDKAITDLVANFEVANERSSAVRYTAEYTFHFRPGEIRRLLGSAATQPAGDQAKADPTKGDQAKGNQAKPDQAKADQSGKGDRAAKAVVVLPVYQADDQARLWEDPNPWRDAWDHHPPATGATHVILPLGDADDLAAIDADKARSGDSAAIAAIAGRNGAADVLVAQATVQGQSDKPTGLDLSVKRYRGGQVVDTHTETLAGKPGENGDALLTRAVNVIGTGLTGGWKKEPAPRYDQEGSLTAILPISGLEDWVKARDRIAGLPMVKKVNLVALSLQEATIEIGYGGSVDQLKSALSPIGLTLARGDAGWRLTRAETGRSQ